MGIALIASPILARAGNEGGEEEPYHAECQERDDDDGENAFHSSKDSKKTSSGEAACIMALPS